MSMDEDNQVPPVMFLKQQKLQADVEIPLDSLVSDITGSDIDVPEIPHISDNFIPLSYVVSRLVSNTYSELVNILETFPAANDVTRKRKFLNFLVHTRQQFIKLLVLTQWSHNADDVSKVIDVVSWLAGQKNCFVNVIWALQNVKQGLSSARSAFVPNWHIVYVLLIRIDCLIPTFLLP